MKTKTLLFLCLFLGIAMTQLPAQTKNHAYSVHYQTESWFPVYCDGIFVEDLYGILNVHGVIFVKDGVQEFQMTQFHGEYISENGEKLKAHEEGIWTREGNVYSSHGNLIGDRGTRYILFVTIYLNPWKVIIEKAMCPGNKNHEPLVYL